MSARLPEATHLHAGRRHSLHKPAPLPQIIPTTREPNVFGGVLVLLSAIAVVLLLVWGYFALMS